MASPDAHTWCNCSLIEATNSGALPGLQSALLKGATSTLSESNPQSGAASGGELREERTPARTYIDACMAPEHVAACMQAHGMWRVHASVQLMAAHHGVALLDQGRAVGTGDGA